MMDEREDDLSINLPSAVPPSSAGNGTDVMVDTGGLLSLCVCMWLCVYACKWYTIPAFVIRGNGKAYEFVFSLCGGSLYSWSLWLCVCVWMCSNVLCWSQVGKLSPSAAWKYPLTLHIRHINAHYSSWLSGSSSPNPKHVCQMQVYACLFLYSDFLICQSRKSIGVND